MKQNLIISLQEDRLTVAAILIKNGYKVCQKKKRSSPTSKSYIYYLQVEEADND